MSRIHVEDWSWLPDLAKGGRNGTWNLSASGQLGFELRASCDDSNRISTSVGRMANAW
jgi:hypothetical protein